MRELNPCLRALRFGQAGHLANPFVYLSEECGIVPIETIANEYWTTQVGCYKDQDLPYGQWCDHASRAKA